MADWKKLAQSALLADGKIDEAEVKLLRKYLWADKIIDDEELDFLGELWVAANKKAKAATTTVTPKFEKLYHEALEKYLTDSKLTPARVKKFGDCIGKPTEGKTKFLTRIKSKVVTKIPEFTKMLEKFGIK